MAFLVTRNHLVLILCFVLVMLIGVRLYYDREGNVRTFSSQNLRSRDVQTLQGLRSAGEQLTMQTFQNGEDSFKVIGKLIQQRNSLSRSLNLKQQKLGQLECEVSRSLEVQITHLSIE